MTNRAVVALAIALAACGSSQPGGTGPTGSVAASSSGAGGTTGEAGSSGAGATSGTGSGRATGAGSTGGGGTGASSAGATTSGGTTGAGSTTAGGATGGKGTTGALSDGGVHPERGVYVPMFGETPSARVLSDPDVDGVYLSVRWSDIQPDGGYDWTALDKMLAAVAASTPAKGISLSIQAGDGTPSWVFASGVPSVHACLVAPATGAAIDETVPVPWNATYQADWQAMIQATADHLRDAGTYGTVGTLKLEGINGHTDETGMPNTPGTCSDGSTTDPDAEWLDAGFTPTLLANTWWTLVSAQGNAFPDKALDLQVISGAGAWPNGSQNKGLNQILIGVAMDGGLGGRFEVQSNGLRNGGGTSQDVTYALGLGALGGYQMFNDVSRDPACGMNKDVLPCDSAVLLGAIDLGLDAGAAFLEIYVEDVENPDAGFVAAVHWAHQALCAGGVCRP